MWFLPFLVVGAIAVAVAKRSSRKAAPPSRQLAAGPPSAPGPISVLGEILRIGQTPPPKVLLCAIAEAQAIGRNDLASDIVQAFIAPVVRRNQRMRRSRLAPTNYDAAEAAYAPVTSAPYQVVPPPPPPMTMRADASAVVSPSTASPPLDQSSMDDEINALLHADPERFMEMASRGSFQAPAPAVAVPPPATPSIDPSDRATDFPPETVAQLQEAAGDPEAADRTRTLAPGSPIPGVPDPAWRDFVLRLARESPQFSSSRHVGQFRQRRERLTELGIDPTAIAGSAQAQRTALDADLADAHRHGVAGEMFAQHLGRPVTLPGRDSAEVITLSGVLGVIQSAGLEGAVGWLERPNDRKRYPHTTQAFVTTNGVF